MISICNKCKQEFKWTIADAIVELDYGTRFIVPCPFCGSMTQVFKENKDNKKE